MTWHRYLDFLVLLLICLLLVGTYRDIFDQEDDSWFDYAIRFVVVCCLGIGLRKRNVWVVRLVYVFALSFLVVFTAATLAIELPLTPLQKLAILAFHIPFSLAVLIPRSELRPKPPSTSEGGVSGAPPSLH